MIRDVLKDTIESVLLEVGVGSAEVELEHPAELEHGDFATNVAMKYAGDSNPREFAERIAGVLRQASTSAKATAGDGLNFLEKIETAGPGFINFYLDRGFFAKSLEDIAAHGPDFGKSEVLEGKQVMVEYTDPNPFKEFHAGHTMSNAVGEAIARLYEWQGADVIRACYQGDVGPHVAKAVWGMRQSADMLQWLTGDASTSEKVLFLGEAYVAGNAAYEESEDAKAEIDEINKRIYDGSDTELTKLYYWGRAVSLEHFETIYRKLGTRFDHYFFESEVFEDGLQLVEEGKEKGVFEESDGAVVYRGEQDGLHTRVFVNSHNLPTYEAKELGLTKRKFNTYTPLDQSVVVTANEQTEYLKVVLAALSKLRPEWAQKTRHIEHGMLRTPDGKMSSRKGNVIGGGTLIEDVEMKAREKIKAGGRDIEDPDKLASEEAVAAIKYAVLRQAPGKNVVFDVDQSLSLEGDSGPYLQYAHTRAVSLRKKAEKEGVSTSTTNPPPDPYILERVLYRFPDVVRHAFTGYSPQLLVTYLTEVASHFNTFYASEQIVDSEDEYSPYKLALTRAVETVLSNGLTMLGIRAPEQM